MYRHKVVHTSEVKGYYTWLWTLFLHTSELFNQLLWQFFLGLKHLGSDGPSF